MIPIFLNRAKMSRSAIGPKIQMATTFRTFKIDLKKTKKVVLKLFENSMSSVWSVLSLFIPVTHNAAGEQRPT